MILCLGRYSLNRSDYVPVASEHRHPLNAVVYEKLRFHGCACATSGDLFRSHIRTTNPDLQKEEALILLPQRRYNLETSQLQIPCTKTLCSARAQRLLTFLPHRATRRKLPTAKSPSSIKATRAFSWPDTQSLCESKMYSLLGPIRRKTEDQLG